MRRTTRLFAIRGNRSSLILSGTEKTPLASAPEGSREPLSLSEFSGLVLSALFWHTPSWGVAFAPTTGRRLPDGSCKALRHRRSFYRLGPFLQHGLFEFRKKPNHLHRHSTRGCGRVDRFRQTAKSRCGLAKLLHDGEHVAKGAREPIKFPHHPDIAFPGVDRGRTRLTRTFLATAPGRSGAPSVSRRLLDGIDHKHLNQFFARLKP